MFNTALASFVEVPASKRHFWILLSPLVVLLLGQLAARTLGPMIGIWSWVPLSVGYWSIILDYTPIKSQRLAVMYSSTLFMINHMWMSVMVIGARNPMAPVFQFVFAVLMSITYFRTKSLRWPLAAIFWLIF